MLDSRAAGRTGRRLGLVLGAGGARGFAHIGALKVIERHQIPIDLVVGVSMGSVVGAGFAAGIPAAAMEEAARSVRIGPLFRPRLSRHGLVDPSGMHGLVRQLFGDRRFEDLDRELAILTASVTTGEPVVIRDGLVADAILASIAIPLLFPPMARGTDHLIDGGMIEGLPVRFARQLGAERVIAIDADNHARRILSAPGFRQVTRRVAALLASCAGDGKPGALLVLSRVLHHMTERSEVEPPDVMIQPLFGRITSFHYHLWTHCLALGEAAAHAALPHVLALVDGAGHLAPRSAWTDAAEAIPIESERVLSLDLQPSA